MSANKFQLNVIDCMRPLLALMVVGLHVRYYFTSGAERFFDGPFEACVIIIFRVMFSVAVPTFFLVSGYFFFKGLETWNVSVWKQKLRKRSKTLLLPYILWNFVAFAGFVVTRCAGHFVKGNDFVNLVDSLNERGWLRIFWDRCLMGPVRADNINIWGYVVQSGTPMNEPCWFLRDLMVVLLFTPVVYFLIREIGRIFILLIGTLFVIDLWIPFSGFSSVSFFFFSLGSWLYLEKHNLLEMSGKYVVLQNVLSVVLLIVASVSFGTNEWLYTVSSRLFLLAAIPSLICLVSSVTQSSPRLESFLLSLSSSSFFIYVIHTVLIVDVVCFAFLSVFGKDNYVISSVGIVISTMIVYTICYFVFIFMNRFMPRIAGLLTGNRIDKR